MSAATIPVPDRETEGRAYTRRLQVAANLHAIFGMVVLYGFGYFGWESRIASEASAWTSVFAVQIALCFLPLGLVWILASVPFWYYSLILQRRFDLAGTNPREWLWVSAKVTLLRLLYIGAVVETAFLSHAWSSSYGWIGAALLNSILFAVVVNSLMWFLSWFFPVTPLRDPGMAERILALAGKAAVGIGRIREAHIGGSTRQANAWVMGFGRFRSLVISATLLRELTPDEVEAFTAHELGHCAHHDVAKRFALQCVAFLAIFGVLDLLVRSDIGIFYDISKGWSDLGFVPGFVLLWLLGNTYANLLMAPWWRRQERAADLYAWKLTGRVEPFINGMKKIADLNKIVFDKSSQWQYAHPVTSDRLQAAAAFAQQHGEVVTCTESLQPSAPVERKTVKSRLASLLACVLTAIGLIVSFFGVFLWYVSPEDWQAALCILLLGAVVFLPVAVQAYLARRKKKLLLRAPASAQ